MAILLTQRDGIIGPIAKLFGFIMNAIFEALSLVGIENIDNRICSLYFISFNHNLIIGNKIL